MMDGGAYCTLSPVVLSRGAIHAAGPYYCPNVRIRGRAVATNTPPHGAFRGFGAPQSIFALERHMDSVAARGRADARRVPPAQLHRAGRDHARPARSSASRSTWTALLDRALALSDYHAKRDAFRAAESRRARSSAASASPRSCTAPASPARARSTSRRSSTSKRTADGRVRVLAASTEIGQGTNTIFAQIAADALGVDYDDVEIAQPDTAVVPNSGPTVASRTVHGRRQAGRDGGASDCSRRSSTPACSPTPTRPRSSRRPAATTSRRAAPLRASSQYEPPPGIHWDDEKYQGDAYGAYAWAVYVAEVTVDIATFEARVDDFVAVQEVGKVIHPVLAAGQIEGGVAQGIGWALYENVVWRDGRMANAPDDQLHHADRRRPAADPRATSRRRRTRTGRSARRASASCRWTGRAGDRQRGRARDRRRVRSRCR